MANKCFATNKECIEAGDYVLKKRKVLSCKPKCVMKPNDLYFLLRKCQIKDETRTTTDQLPYNYNLNMNLFTTLDLNRVKVIEDSFDKNSNTINKTAAANFYRRYIIDPKGELFGNTPCGYDNYLSYLIETPQKIIK